MVLSSRHSHCENSVGSFDECGTAPGSRRPLDQDNRLGPVVRLNKQLYSVHIYHRHFITLLLSPKARTHFTVLRRRIGWLNRWFTCPQAVTHPTINRARRSATSLIDSNTFSTKPNVQRRRSMAWHALHTRKSNTRRSMNSSCGKNSLAFASNLEQVANLLYTQVNSASYPQRDGKW